MHHRPPSAAAVLGRQQAPISTFLGTLNAKISLETWWPQRFAGDMTCGNEWHQIEVSDIKNKNLTDAPPFVGECSRMVVYQLRSYGTVAKKRKQWELML
jgi:hypothetical protein